MNEPKKFRETCSKYFLGFRQYLVIIVVFIIGAVIFLR